MKFVSAIAMMNNRKNSKYGRYHAKQSLLAAMAFMTVIFQLPSGK